VKKKEVLNLETQDTLLAGHKFLSDKMEVIGKKLEAKEVARLSTNDIGYD